MAYSDPYYLSNNASANWREWKIWTSLHIHSHKTKTGTFKSFIGCSSGVVRTITALKVILKHILNDGVQVFFIPNNLILLQTCSAIRTSANSLRLWSSRI